MLRLGTFDNHFLLGIFVIFSYGFVDPHLVTTFRWEGYSGKVDQIAPHPVW